MPCPWKCQWMRFFETVVASCTLGLRSFVNVKPLEIVYGKCMSKINVKRTIWQLWKSSTRFIIRKQGVLWLHYLQSFEHGLKRAIAQEERVFVSLTCWRNPTYCGQYFRLCARMKSMLFYAHIGNGGPILIRRLVHPARECYLLTPLAGNREGS